MDWLHPSHQVNSPLEPTWGMKYWRFGIPNLRASPKIAFNTVYTHHHQLIWRHEIEGLEF